MNARETLYFKQVDLLLNILPLVSRIEDFALKGGTAINLFVRHMPAIQWKMMNLEKMNSKKHKAAYEKLERVLRD